MKDRSTFFRIVFVSTCCALGIVGHARGQNTGYGSYYSKNVNPAAAINAGTDRYLYDKYFYRNSAVSPYLSSVRGGSYSSTAYATSVLPELQRRESANKRQMAYVQQRKMRGNVGYTANPGAGFIGSSSYDVMRKPAPPSVRTPSAYHNHWYGKSGIR